jgi:hypothetical protein
MGHPPAVAQLLRTLITNDATESRQPIGGLYGDRYRLAWFALLLPDIT